MPGLAPGLSDGQLMDAIAGRIVDSAKVMGKFARP
jgi:hypothetical protein